MILRRFSWPRPQGLARAAFVAFCALFASACSDGSDGERAASGPPDDPEPTSTVLEPSEDAPGLALSIVAVSGASGSGGSFRVGDRITVRYTLTKDDGSPWGLAEMTHARAMVSGPTFNYQRVIPERTDLAGVSLKNADGSYSYRFPPRIPAVYAAPYNDSAAFGPLDGELAGEPLLAGTYTVGLAFVWAYTVEGVPFVDVGEAVRDVLVGNGAGVVAPREVVNAGVCDRCHVELSAHGRERRNVTQCMMCHTSGAEDANDPALLGGTPGTSIDARVLFHALHNGRHQPSVVGVGVNMDGTLDYDAAPRRLVYARPDGSTRDYSNVGFPAWPNRTFPMPKDTGYTALPAAARAKDDVVRAGVVACDVCHGDPDGPGPITAPAQGGIAYAQPTRRACGACHDDIDWELCYVTNGQAMPPQPDDSGCTLCHESSVGALAVEQAHRHPMFIPFFNPGLHFELLAVVESGTNDGNGTIDRGEKVSVTFTITDDMGADVGPASLDEISAVVSGPTPNLQVLLASHLPPGLLAGPQPYTIDLPERRALEYVGDATAALGDTFTTTGAPHHPVAGAETQVFVRSATSGGATALAVAVSAPRRFVDVVDASGFERDDHIVLDDGVPGAEEYLRVRLVDGDRLWFSSPAERDGAAGVRIGHAAGARVLEVTLTELALGVDVALDAAAGEITELVELGAGNAVVVSYTTDFVMPDRFPMTLHGSDDVGETWGEWQGKGLVAGTYVVGLWGGFTFDFFFGGASNVYPVVARAATAEFLVESAGVLEPYDAIETSGSCLECHQDVLFHGGRDRGFDACILCHGAAGAEDLPRSVAANAPATSGVTVSFRSLLHKIHRGPLLDDPAGFVVVGAGGAPFPDNFEVNTYENTFFPAQPDATARCSKCHGASNASWQAPATLDHPFEQVIPSRPWRVACGACHDSAADLAHVDVHTSPAGLELCGVCHADGSADDVTVAHKAR